MTSGGSSRGGNKPGSDDGWDRLARANKAILQGREAENEEVGDTSRLVSKNTQRLQVASADHSSEILDLLNDALAAAPERGDLWVMRFEAQKSLGLKHEFANAMIQAWKTPAIYRQLDWTAIRTMWQELAPGELLPAELKLIDKVTTEMIAAPIAQFTAAGTARNRRFSDIATQVAGRELSALAKAYAQLHTRPRFVEEFERRVAPMLMRPTPLHYSERMSQAAGPHARIFLKREDQRRVSPELDHAAAQCYIAVLLGKSSVITANDVDAHALATAEMAPRFKLACTVLLNPAAARQPEFLARLRQLGAKVEPMSLTGMIGHDPREAAVRRWQQSNGASHLVLSLGTAPAPYPAMASNFQALLGRETDAQYHALEGSDTRAQTFVAAVESESDSLGFVLPQLGRKNVEVVYAEPEPGGVASWRASMRLKAYNGQIREHAWLRGTGRIEHVALSDAAARDVRERLSRNEQIELSLEDARAVALAELLTQRDKAPRDFVVLVA